MKTSSKTLFMFMLISSTILVLSSSSWLNMWMGLEINLMSFIPLISSPKNMFLSQSTMMYFLIQSMSSMMFITLILVNKYMFLYLKGEFIKIMIILTMMMKMGMPPFHMWLPEVMNKISWTMCLILMTWQKVAPMYIMSMAIYMNKLTIMAICASAIVGATGGLNQTSTRKIMAYSSMNHMSWLAACTATYKKSWVTYILLYSMLMIIISLMMYSYNIMYINQMNIIGSMNMEKMTFMSLMLSAGGIPPFLGFLPKWITIQYMISSKEFLMMSIMMMSALITLMYYLRMSSLMNLIMGYSQKWMVNMYSKKNMSTWILMTNSLLPMLILTFNFF
uniref:NADH-ubiquinone oxidoreductase chain 2 n=1 Tax=Tuxedo drakei TaxID=981287 RepID=A0A514LQ01_9HEMI|nr:NADH dehydrogenase subunit 2 [Tuxedo drakei]